MRITGFNWMGEAVVVNDDNRIVACGELHLDNAHITGIDKGDEFPLTFKVTWTKHEAEIEAGWENFDEWRDS